MKDPIQSHFYDDWNQAQRDKRMANLRKAYRKAGIKPRKDKGRSWT
jgi:hypothetical protein